MIVVADTSPLNYLILIEWIDVLEILYERVYIPHAVHDEMLDANAPPAVRLWAQNPPSWLELLSPSATGQPFLLNLDAGEAEAIALAREMHADWLLIDESDGREEAARAGLQTIGTLGVLRNAHVKGLLDLRIELPRLQTSGFYASQRLIADLLASV